MDGSVAICAALKESLRFLETERFTRIGGEVLGNRSVRDDPCSRDVVMPQVSKAMARHADGRLRGLDQVLRDGPMRIVARHAALDDGRMLENPGALHVPVTGGAAIVFGRISDISIAMGIVAGKTTEGAFANRMMGRQLESGLFADVAPYAKLRRGIRVAESRGRANGPKILLRTVVRVVAIRADQSRRVVISAVPFEMTRESDSVARQAILTGWEPNLLDLLAIRVKITAAVTVLAVRMK
jgi:hypothetical protein